MIYNIGILTDEKFGNYSSSYEIDMDDYENEGQAAVALWEAMCEEAFTTDNGNEVPFPVPEDVWFENYAADWENLNDDNIQSLLEDGERKGFFTYEVDERE